MKRLNREQPSLTHQMRQFVVLEPTCFIFTNIINTKQSEHNEADDGAQENDDEREEEKEEEDAKREQKRNARIMKKAENWSSVKEVLRSNFKKSRKLRKGENAYKHMHALLGMYHSVRRRRDNEEGFEEFENLWGRIGVAYYNEQWGRHPDFHRTLYTISVIKRVFPEIAMSEDESLVDRRLQLLNVFMNITERYNKQRYNSKHELLQLVLGFHVWIQYVFKRFHEMTDAQISEVDLSDAQQLLEWFRTTSSVPAMKKTDVRFRRLQYSYFGMYTSITFKASSCILGLQPWIRYTLPKGRIFSMAPNTDTYRLLAACHELFEGEQSGLEVRKEMSWNEDFVLDGDASGNSMIFSIYSLFKDPRLIYPPPILSQEPANAADAANANVNENDIVNRNDDESNDNEGNSIDTTSNQRQPSPPAISISNTNTNKASSVRSGHSAPTTTTNMSNAPSPMGSLLASPMHRHQISGRKRSRSVAMGSPSNMNLPFTPNINRNVSIRMPTLSGQRTANFPQFPALTPSNHSNIGWNGNIAEIDLTRKTQ